MKVWILLDDKDKVVEWAGARFSRTDLIREANQCMAATMYERLTEKERWAYQRKRGYRCVRATLTPAKL